MWITGRTDIGKCRESNQDTFFAGEVPGGGYALVCDGMGGERGGLQASTLAGTTASTYIRSDIKAGMTEAEVRSVLENTGMVANALVRERACQEPELEGMGTTLSAMVVTGCFAHFLHAGDSRIYLLRKNKLYKLTTDHTFVQMLVNQGKLTPEQAKTHPQRNCLTRAVGVDFSLRYEIFSMPLWIGDVFLICSDGLYNSVSEDELYALVAECAEKRDAKPLIDCALSHGGEDNITAVLCKIDGEEGVRIG